MALSDPMRAAWYYCEALSFYRRVEYPLLPQVRVELEQLVASSCGFLEATSLHGMDRRLPPLQS